MPYDNGNPLPLSNAIADVIRHAERAIVGIRVPARGHRYSHASGVIVEPGVVVTNAHVVGNRSRLHVGLHDGQKLETAVYGVDRGTDLAVLGYDESPVAGLAWGDSDALEAGNIVVAVANPLALDRTASLGIISSTNRRLALGGGTRMDGVLQTDAAVAPGSSGGALLDLSGTVVGILVAHNIKYRGLSFAIPASTCRRVVADLAEHGFVRLSYLGLFLEGVPLPIAEARGADGHGGERRVRVVRVVAGGPGEIAGLMVGDWLLSADGEPLRGVYSVRQHLGVDAVGLEVPVDLLRDGEVLRVGLRPMAMSM